jgi:peptidylprolyl isomerase
MNHIRRNTTHAARLAAAAGLLSLICAPAALAAEPKAGTAPAAKPAPQAPAPAAPAAAAKAAPAPAGTGETIARAGTTELKESDIRNYIAALGQRERAALAQDPAQLAQFVRVLLVNQLVLKEAVAKQWDQQPANAAVLQRARESALIEAYMQAVSAPAAGFPVEADVQKAYEANKASLQVPKQYNLAQIYVSIGKDADKASKDKAKQEVDEIAAKLKAPGADFAAIARGGSDAKETAANGGEIGWVAETQLRGEIKPLVLGLTKGGITDPIQVDDGWQIIKLLDVKEARTLELAEVREALAQRLREEQAVINRRAYVAGLLKQDAPVIHELALTKLLGAANAPSASQ